MINKIDKAKISVCLKELSDYEFQKRTWLATSGPEVSSFSELISQLFDDSGLSDALGNASGEIFNTQTDKMLRALDEAISRINQRLPPAILLEDKKMQLVRKLAADALDSLEEKPKELKPIEPKTTSI